MRTEADAEHRIENYTSRIRTQSQMEMEQMGLDARKILLRIQSKFIIVTNFVFLYTHFITHSRNYTIY